jgi:hypothetical protein
VVKGIVNVHFLPRLPGPEPILPKPPKKRDLTREVPPPKESCILGHVPNTIDRGIIGFDSRKNGLIAGRCAIIIAVVRAVVIRVSVIVVFVLIIGGVVVAAPGSV